jgi:hypothetical protein
MNMSADYDTSPDSPYARRVRQLEDEGLTTSDAQGVADVEFEQCKGPIIVGPGAMAEARRRAEFRAMHQAVRDLLTD